MTNIITSYQTLIEKMEMIKDFEEFTLLIRKKNSLELTNNFLIYLDIDIKKVNSRDFLSIFLINQFHIECLSKEKNFLENKIYEIAKQTVNEIKNYLIENGKHQSKTNLNKTILNFKIHFTIWLKKDKEDLLKLLAKYHTETRKILKENENSEERLKILSKIESLAKKISPQNGVEHVKTSSKLGMVDNDMLMLQITNNMKNAFWDLVISDFSSNPPNFRQYPKLVDEIRKKFIGILPRAGLSQTVKIMNQYLSTSRIESKLKNKTYSIQDVYELITFCYEKLKELDSEGRKKILENKIIELDKDVLSKELKMIIPKHFRYILENLDQIKAIKNEFVRNEND